MTHAERVDDLNRQIEELWSEIKARQAELKELDRGEIKCGRAKLDLPPNNRGRWRLSIYSGETRDVTGRSNPRWMGFAMSADRGELIKSLPGLSRDLADLYEASKHLIDD